MKYKVGDKVRVREDLEVGDGFGCTTAVVDMLKYRGKIVTIKEARSSVVGNYTIYEIDDDSEFWAWTDEMLEPAYADGGYVPYHKIPTPSKPVLIADQLDSLADAWSRLGCTSFQMATDVINRALKKSEEKNLKFTFYTEEGYRIDKSNNSKVETITTFVKINNFDNTYLGMATCDKADYSERDGILNAIANAVLGGNFDREYEKFLADKKRKYDESCKCKICGRNYYEDEKTGKRTPFTPEDARKHEEWHEQNKKNKREKYLIRKEAKRRLAEAEREGKIEQTMKELYKK